MPPEPLGILLISGAYDRAHYAFMLAAAAAAIGRPTVLFATNAGCHALAQDWSALEGATADAANQSKGVAGLAEIREAAIELGARLLACDSGLLLSGLPPTALLATVEIAGIPTFLSATTPGQLITL